jgi:hypothetical protein
MTTNVTTMDMPQVDVITHPKQGFGLVSQGFTPITSQFMPPLSFPMTILVVD